MWNLNLRLHPGFISCFAMRLLQQIKSNLPTSTSVSYENSIIKQGFQELKARLTELQASHIDVDNLLVGMYAIRALEKVGPAASEVLPAIKDAADSPYEFTRRFAKRLSSQLQQ